MRYLALLALGLLGCQAQRTTCAVIRLANEACTVIEYVDEQGQLQRVSLTPDQAREFARAASSKVGAPLMDDNYFCRSTTTTSAGRPPS